MPVRENKAARPSVGRYGTDGLSHIRFGPVDSLGPIKETCFDFENCSRFESDVFPETRPRSPLEADLDSCTNSGAGVDRAEEEVLDGETRLLGLLREGEDELRHTFVETKASPKVLGGETLGAGRGPRHGRQLFRRRTMASIIFFAIEPSFG